MADLTGYETGADGKSPAQLLKAIGSFCQLIPFQVVGSANSNAGATTTISFPALRSIAGFVVMNRSIANGDMALNDAGLVTSSGVTLTFTESVGGDAELQIYSGLVWGPAKL